MVYFELIAGFALLAAGGDFLVRGAVAVARRIGVSELMIGLTLVGFGTSTPELVASVEAARWSARRALRSATWSAAPSPTAG